MKRELYEQHGCLKVFVYFNLHRKCWSLKAMEGPRKGRVIGHCSTLALDGVTFKVSEAGRQRVLRERKKNVHAGVVGWLREDVPTPSVWWKQAYYNPYKVETFVTKDSGTPVKHAKQAVLLDRQVWFNEVGA